MDSLITPLLWFALVVAAIPAALWLLKRSPVGGGLQARGLRCVGVLPLSGTQRIVTVEVGLGEERRWLVLGVTPNAIATLHTLPPQGDAAAAPGGPGASSGSFPDWLSRLKGSESDRHAR
jgi:flagellar protein FliO/FliZ